MIVNLFTFIVTQNGFPFLWMLLALTISFHLFHFVNMIINENLSFISTFIWNSNQYNRVILNCQWKAHSREIIFNHTYRKVAMTHIRTGTSNETKKFHLHKCERVRSEWIIICIGRYEPIPLKLKRCEDYCMLLNTKMTKPQTKNINKLHFFVCWIDSFISRVFFPFLIHFLIKKFIFICPVWKRVNKKSNMHKCNCYLDFTYSYWLYAYVRKRSNTHFT